MVHCQLYQARILPSLSLHIQPKHLIFLLEKKQNPNLNLLKNLSPVNLNQESLLNQNLVNLLNQNQANLINLNLVNLNPVNLNPVNPPINLNPAKPLVNHLNQANRPINHLNLVNRSLLLPLLPCHLSANLKHHLKKSVKILEILNQLNKNGQPIQDQLTQLVKIS